MANEIMPPSYFYLGILLIISVHFILPIIQIISYPYTLIGLLLIILGATYDFLAWRMFIKSKTTQNPFKNPNKFITRGVYTTTRNPMYLGMLLVLVGISLLLGGLVTFICPLIFFIIIQRLFIPLEEKNMEKQFGKRYLKYKSKVRRWI